ncbi:MAG: anti-sigma factor [Devosia sp.]
MSTEGHSGGREDDQVLVAEYALGLLEGSERAVVAHRIATEPALGADMSMWRQRLSTLDSQFTEVRPPAGVLPKVETRLWGDGAEKEARRGGWLGWWSSLPVLRGMVLAGHILAFGAIGYIFLVPQADPTVLATQLVAAIQAQDGYGIEFIAVYDEAQGEVRVASLRGDAVPDQDYELWYIKGDAPAVSMGVLPVNEKREIALDDAARASIEPGTVFAVTLEAKGGSPTGVAQGPIVAVGTATEI